MSFDETSPYGIPPDHIVTDFLTPGKPVPHQILLSNWFRDAKDQLYRLAKERDVTLSPRLSDSHIAKGMAASQLL